MNRRQVIFATGIELVALGLACYLLLGERAPNVRLAVQRGGYLACQQIARGFGALAIELEKSYRAKVAP